MYNAINSTKTWNWREKPWSYPWIWNINRFLSKTRSLWKLCINAVAIFLDDRERWAEGDTLQGAAHPLLCTGITKLGTKSSTSFSRITFWWAPFVSTQSKGHISYPMESNTVYRHREVIIWNGVGVRNEPHTPGVFSPGLHWHEGEVHITTYAGVARLEWKEDRNDALWRLQLYFDTSPWC